MSDVPDFVEGGDAYDPEWQAQHDKLRADTVSEVTSAEKQYIAERSRAYKEVFSPGETSEGALEFVMKDLAKWSRAYEPTFHPTNGKIQDMLEGRRETFQRIMQYTHLSADTLFNKYMMDAINRGM